MCIEEQGLSESGLESWPINHIGVQLLAETSDIDLPSDCGSIIDAMEELSSRAIVLIDELKRRGYTVRVDYKLSGEGYLHIEKRE